MATKIEIIYWAREEKETKSNIRILNKHIILKRKYILKMIPKI